MITTEDWVIVSNGVVAVTSILVAAASEHDAVRAMRDTILGALHAILPTRAGGVDPEVVQTPGTAVASVDNMDGRDGAQEKEKG